MTHPRIGIGVCILRAGEVLVGKRKNAHGEGSWCFPGGHLEFGESWEECARREVLEETGLELGEVRYATATNDVFTEEKKHYVTIFMAGEYLNGEAEVLEPEKGEGWEWCSWHQIPEPRFLALQHLSDSGWTPESA